jgi:uncharacterized protein
MSEPTTPPPPPQPSTATPGEPAAAAPYAPGPYAPVPMSPDQERSTAMLAHLISLFALLLTSGWIPALIFYVVYKDRGAFVRAHTATELNFQLTLVLGWIAAFILSFVLVGFLLIFAIPILAIVFGIISTMRANSGQWYTYPVAIRFVK